MRNIESTNEDVEMVFEAFFKIPMRVFSIDKDGDIVGFAAAPGIAGGESTVESRAADTWDSLYRGRIFSDVHSILITYMDCCVGEREGTGV